MLRRPLLFSLLIMAILLSCTGCGRTIKRRRPTYYKEAPPSVSIGRLQQEIAAEGRQSLWDLGLRGSDDGRVISQEALSVDKTRDLRLSLLMKKSGVWIRGGSEDLLSARVVYPKGASIPEMISVTEGLSRSVELLAGTEGNEWEIGLNSAIPVGILMEAEEGYRDFRLGDVLLTDLSVQALHGTTVMEVGGDQPILLDSSVAHGSGSIAAWYNADFAVLNTVHLRTGKGDIAASFNGRYPKLTNIIASTTGGNVELDLRGAFDRPCEVEVTATDGDCVIWVPWGLGTSVTVHRPTEGTVHMPGFTKKWSSGAYVNDAFTRTKAFLSINVYITSGSVRVYQMSDYRHWLPTNEAVMQYVPTTAENEASGKRVCVGNGSDRVVP